MTASDRHRRPLVELLFLAAPTVAQMASYTVMQFIDTWILSRLSGEAATAAANSGLLAFAGISFGMGVIVLVNSMVSQSFGRGDFRDCGTYLWQGIWVGVLIGLGLASLIPLGGTFFHAFGHAPRFAQMEVVYWRIVLIAPAVKLISLALGQFHLGVDRPFAPLVSAVVGVSINAVAALALVLGRFGFHSWGVAGAAWAQNIGITVEMLVLIGFAMRPTVRKTFGTLQIRPRVDYMVALVRVGVPSGVQWFSDVLAWGVFCNGVLAVVGIPAMQANTFMLRYMVVMFMPAIGIGAAVTALVGRYIGRGEPDMAERRAHLGFFVCLLYVIPCGFFFIVARRPLMSVFTSDPEVLRIGEMYLIFAAVYEIFDAMYINYISALRGAGDTLVPAVVMGITCWTISVFGGWVVAKWAPEWNPAGPWVMGCVYGAMVGIFMVARFRGGKWRGIRMGTGAASNVPGESTKLEATI
jgi:MATE family multidrug resistance protein